MSSLLGPIRCVPRWWVIPCLVALGSSTWLGQKIQKPRPEITLIFFAYDTQGKEVKAQLIGPKDEVTPQEAGGNCRFSRPIGTSIGLQFQRLDPEEPPKTEAVLWRSQKDFLQWLETDFREQLKRLDPDYNKQKWDELIKRLKGRASSTACDYPVVFKALE